MQLEGHADAGSDDPAQHLHVGEDPLVALRRDAEVALEERVQAAQEEVDAATKVVVSGRQRTRWSMAVNGRVCHGAASASQRHFILWTRSIVVQFCLLWHLSAASGTC